MRNNGIERVKWGQTRGRSMGRNNKPQKPLKTPYRKVLLKSSLHFIRVELE